MPDATLVDEMIELVRTEGKIEPEVVVAADKLLVDDLGIDSLDLVGVFLSIQDKYGVAIDDDELPKLLKVSDLAEYVAKNRAA